MTIGPNPNPWIGDGDENEYRPALSGVEIAAIVISSCVVAMVTVVVVLLVVRSGVRYAQRRRRLSHERLYDESVDDGFGGVGIIVRPG